MNGEEGVWNVKEVKLKWKLLLFNDRVGVWWPGG